MLDPLTDPTAHGGHPEDAFHVVVPSLPGYGFSGRPAEPGWDIHRIARAWAELMTRLGTTGSSRRAATGARASPPASPCNGRNAYSACTSSRRSPLPTATSRTPEEHQALADLDERNRTGSAYSAVHATRPQTLGYGLLDSPAALCAWIVEKVWTWADHDGDLDAVLGRDRVLDNVSLYWLTGTGASSTRLYWESIAEVSEWFTTVTDDRITVPTAGSVFPREVPRPSRRWAARRFTNIVHWGRPERGGHFAAWEQPDLFVAEARAARRACLAAES